MSDSVTLGSLIADVPHVFRSAIERYFEPIVTPFRPRIYEATVQYDNGMSGAERTERFEAPSDYMARRHLKKKFPHATVRRLRQVRDIKA